MLKAAAGAREGQVGQGQSWSSLTSIPRVGLPEEIASLVAWLLCDSSQYISGTVQQIDGGWYC